MRHTLPLALLLCAGAAHADNAIPDQPGEHSRFAQVAVNELPKQAVLRSVLFVSNHQGCSMSYQSTQDALALTLHIDGKRAELSAEGTSREVSGGRSSVQEHPRTHRDETHRIGGRWTGYTRIESETLAIDFGAHGKLSCTIRPLPREGSPDGRTVNALVCAPVATPGPEAAHGATLSSLPGLAAQLPHLPFGRGAGLQASVSYPRYSRPIEALPAVSVAKL